MSDKSLRHLLGSPGFPYGAEVVATRGITAPGQPDKIIELGEALATDDRVSWISVTDNPGGSPMLPPDWLANILASKRSEVVIHLTCKDINRNGIGFPIGLTAMNGRLFFNVDDGIHGQ